MGGLLLALNHGLPHNWMFYTLCNARHFHLTRNIMYMKCCIYLGATISDDNDITLWQWLALWTMIYINHNTHLTQKCLVWHKIAHFNTKIPFLLCISCHCHYQTSCHPHWNCFPPFYPFQWSWWYTGCTLSSHLSICPSICWFNCVSFTTPIEFIIYLEALLHFEYFLFINSKIWISAEFFYFMT